MLFCCHTYRRTDNGGSGAQLTVILAVVAFTSAIGGCTTGNHSAHAFPHDQLLIIQVNCVQPVPRSQELMRIWCSEPMLVNSKDRASKEAVSDFQAGVTRRYTILLKQGGEGRKHDSLFQLRLSDLDAARLEAERAVRSLLNSDPIRDPSRENERLALDDNLVASVRVSMSADNLVECEVFEPYWTIKTMPSATRLSPTSIRFTTHGSIFIVSVYAN